jgi:hypothetical protein
MTFPPMMTSEMYDTWYDWFLDQPPMLGAIADLPPWVEKVMIVTARPTEGAKQAWSLGHPGEFIDSVDLTIEDPLESGLELGSRHLVFMVYPIDARAAEFGTLARNAGDFFHDKTAKYVILLKRREGELKWVSKEYGVMYLATGLVQERLHPEKYKK